MSRLAISQRAARRQENIGAAAGRAFWRTAAQASIPGRGTRHHLAPREHPHTPL